ncbi:hypothetical protein B566_EDAN014477 [Ephemera danica]|nr:hypothetical protein B566_EDAN014477 [Ephemera danica]
MVECISTMVLVSAAAVSSIFLATAAFFRGFTDPPAPARRSTRPPRPVPTTGNQDAAASGPLGIRFNLNSVDALEEEALQGSHPVSSSSPPSQHDPPLFSARFDNVDVHRILSNRRLMRNYIGCVLGNKPCTAEVKEFRRALPDVLLTECAKCSERMKNNIMMMVRGLQRDYPREWEQLIKIYDPDGSHRRRYTQYLEHQAQTSGAPGAA